jgi:hypothetical protein
MFRKITFALATAATLGAAALAPAPASAHPIGFGGPGHGPHFVGPYRFGRLGFGVGVAAGIVGAGIAVDSCYRREVIDTPYGPEVRLVNICY